VLDKRALEIREKIFGPDGVDVETSLSELATLYFRDGKFSECEQFFKRYVTNLEKVCGPNDPRLPIALENYALVLRKTNQAEEADKVDAQAKDLKASTRNK
jgi:hypothetical protein